MEQQQPGRVGRRLSAIVAADVAGYSRLMGLDEVGTARTLREHRAVTDALVAKHGGRLVKSTGDGVLLEFPSVVDAVECAVAVQAVMDQRNEGVPADRQMLFRIGINLGDILIEGDDILGDGVNVAARLEGIAEPGGICISSSAYDQVRGKVEVEFADLGEQRLKNIDRPVRVYAAKPSGHLRMVALGALPSHPETQKPLPLPDKPSIAVLPFQNMSGDPEQEYFADGMVEDIITGLSRSKSLFVIARNSTFTYKGKAVDIKQVGRELGVRYVLEGSVRKSGNKVRITGQLIEASTGTHLWADRFDGVLEDVFDLQDRVTTSVIGAILPQVERVEIDRAQRKPTESLQAYDYYLRALGASYRYSREANLEVMELSRAANRVDPDFSLSYALAAYSLATRKAFGWSTDMTGEIAETRRLSAKAIELDRDDARVLALAGFPLAYLAGEVERAGLLVRQAVQIDPNLGLARMWMGWINVYLGEHEAGIEQLEIAQRLNPLDPRRYVARTAMAYAHFFVGRHEEASKVAATAIRQQPNYLVGQRIMMACHAVMGRLDEARASCAAVMQIDPSQRVSRDKAWGPFQRPQDMKKLKEAFLIAGMPQ
jgi:TolB-like protein/class 3 adenylate cyclase